MKSIEDIELFLKSRHKFGIQLGLERMKRLLALLNNPEQTVKAIHVGGTNGKGSVVHMTANALISMGYKVGVFTSPSFTSVKGHFLINNQEIDNDQLIESFNRIRPIVEKLDKKGIHVTEFEMITTIAFLYFDQQVDFAIFEVGMGGLYDTTNCIDPILSIITTISIDHEQFLGSSIEEITTHKAGIIKQNRSVIVGPLKDRSLTIIKQTARKLQSQLFIYGKSFYTNNKNEITCWTGSKYESLSLQLSLYGKHQLQNASIVVMALFQLQNLGFIQIDWEKIQHALENTNLPGRFEMIHTKPMIILDSAHNIASIKALIETLDTKIDASNVHILFAGFKDKNIQEMISFLHSHCSAMTITTFTHDRAATKSAYRSILKRYPKIHFASNWQSWLEEICALKDANKTYVITGSLHFIVNVRNYIRQSINKM